MGAAGRPEVLALVRSAALDDATLRAPFTGVVARRYVENFANVRPGDPVVLLQQLDQLDLEFDVPGAVVATLSNADRPSATAVLDSLPGQALPAAFVEFSTQAYPSTQTYRGRVSIERPEGATLLPGMIGQVTLNAGPGGETGMVLPVSAVVAEPDGAPYGWVVVPPGTALEKRTVETGAVRGDAVSGAGLETGEMVAVAGTRRLRAGMVVRPVTEIAD